MAIIDFLFKRAKNVRIKFIIPTVAMITLVCVIFSVIAGYLVRKEMRCTSSIIR